MLGGVCVDPVRGLLGHSDADVLLHAVCDALLGAAALGDIGKHFPDTDERFKGISSIELLRCIAELVSGAGYATGNIDVTLLLEAPKIAPFVEQMREYVSVAAGIPKESVSIKATTNEGLGAIGRKEGCAAMAVALLVARSGKAKVSPVRRKGLKR
jgi:2-C-methyl-D-erythritol 2,4-cyclodiphosphate synthase